MASALANGHSTPRHEEYQYLDLIQRILDNGEYRPDRTGTGTISLFAPPQLRFSLSRKSTTTSNTSTSDPSAPSPSPSPNPSTVPILPLLTTKRVFTRAVIAELLWFISASTSSLPLSAAGIKIWDGNGSREFLDNLGLTHRAVGDLGPVYGFQWRHFGAEYVDAETDYTGQGVDQLAEVIHKLRTNPHDRRIILSAWNPADLKKMALPPCHMFCQFYVSFPGVRGADAAATMAAVAAAAAASPTNGDTAAAAAAASQPATPAQPPRGVLTCQLYQRSCDMGLGVPFNIASYALLTHMLAHACDLDPGELVHTMGDAHVYLDHVDALREQLQREPRAFPELDIRNQVRGSGSVDGWSAEDFEVRGYKPHAAIAMKMSV